MNTGQWFYREEGRRVGPVSLDQLVEWLRASREPLGELIWRHGLERWLPAQDVAEIAHRLSGAQTADDALGEEAAAEFAAVIEAEEAAVEPDAIPREGELSKVDFAELVQDLHQQRWTGAVTVERGAFTKTLYAKEGRLVFATSSSPDDRLGELLLRKGRVNLQQYLAAGRAVGQGRRLGAVLVEQGALQAEEIVTFVTEHTREVIYGLFLWTEGSYRLKEGLDRDEAITLRISTPDLILQGIKRIESWSRIERGIGGVSALYERADDWEKRLRNVTLSAEERAIVASHDAPRDVSAVCLASELKDFDVCRTLWAFRVIGVLRHLPPDPSA